MDSLPIGATLSARWLRPKRSRGSSPGADTCLRPGCTSVRHGATQLTAEDRFSGAVGVDLSDEGRVQAAQPRRAAPTRPRSRAIYAARCRGRSRRRASLGRRAALALERRAMACARSATAAGKGSRAREVESAIPRRVRRVGRGSVHLRAGGRRVGRRGARARAAGDPRDRHAPPGRARARRLAQGHDSHPAQQPARLRRARLPRPPRSGARVPERARLPRCRARAPDAVQRHVALGRVLSGVDAAAAPRGSSKCTRSAPS